MAPLQGFTDYVYRNAHASCFNGIITYFIPYISIKNDAFLKKHERDILPENNALIPVVPQILIKDEREIIQVCEFLKSHQYKQVNINMGCPYPMVTNRGRGSGLPPFPERLDEILSKSLPNIGMEVSIKLRSGLADEHEIEKVIKVLNKYSLKEIIYHPRIAKQLYKGKVDIDLFEKIKPLSKNKLVYNGDINSVADYNKLKSRLPEFNTCMIGRGILKDPFLAEKISAGQEDIPGKKERLAVFHDKILSGYAKIYEGDGHLFTKMKQFWAYFSFSFANQHKVFKVVKKTNNMSKYHLVVRKIFDDFL